MTPLLIRSFTMVTLVVMLSAVPLAIAHSNDHSMKGSHDNHQPLADHETPPEYPPTYFSHLEHASLMHAHIALMTIAWVVILPLGMYITRPSLRRFLWTTFPGACWDLYCV